MWGANVLLECGAIYRNIPLHQIAHKHQQWQDVIWTPGDAQTWNCYGNEFSILEYLYLVGQRLRIMLRNKSELCGQYVCTFVPIGDAWSSHPEQSKEFTLVALDNGRYTCQPTNQVLVEDPSFTTVVEWPTWLSRQTQTWSAEHQSHSNHQDLQDDISSDSVKGV